MRSRLFTVVAAFVAMALALWAANLWLYHGWLSSGPPTANPAYHRSWSIRFLVMAAAAAAAATMLIIRAVRMRGVRRPASTGTQDRR